ncbi:hypothetical protein MKY91_01450 [Alkalicoccobacillus gibsonii]|uniref:Uncharacterized protein n=1 Tax=Alkalicoccobacillus gibsonii TaxID=79881 RepID=A0ABU9VD56_9BACI
MFSLIRNVDGSTETLKDSSSQLDKTFNTFSEASLLAKKLNRITNEGLHWEVHETIEPII